jgi:hypothetical protein
MGDRAGPVEGLPVNHPGPTLGYRVEDQGKVLAYISDHEPALGVDLATASPEWVSGYGVAQGADVLFHDARTPRRSTPCAWGGGIRASPTPWPSGS